MCDNKIKENCISEKQIISELLKITFIIYFIFFVAIVLFKTIFSYVNGDDFVGTFMMAFRSFIFGTVVDSENIFSTRFESIGLFTIHFTIFFGMILYRTIFAGNKISGLKNVLIDSLFIIIGVVLTITMGKNMLFCLPEAMIFAGILNMVKCLIGNFDKNNGKQAFENIEISEDFYKKVVKAYSIFIIVLSVVAFAQGILPYIIE